MLVHAGAFAQAPADADTFFRFELPTVREWTFTREDAGRIVQPVLAVLGADSNTVSPVIGERHDLLLSWLPWVEPFVLPNATHLLQLQNSRRLAEALAAFFARHLVELARR